MRILVTPLNWGLGHATRCIPLIDALLAAGHEVQLASDGAAKALLARHYPRLPLHDLPALNIRYPSRNMVLNMLLAAPQLAWMYMAERRAVERLHKVYGFDAVISDNRFGCRLEGKPSYIMTHQVHLPLPDSPGGNMARRLNHFLLSRFEEILICDQAPPHQLAGRMSEQLPGTRCSYLGILSRFGSENPLSCSEAAKLQRLEADARPLLLAVLSGPEPQRSKLEEALLSGLVEKANEYQLVLIRGLPEEGQGQKATQVLAKAWPQWHVLPYLGASALEQLLARSAALKGGRSGVLICRSGYSSIMDLVAIGQPAIYVPTPGQPEQEWLAGSLHEKGWGIRLEQQALLGGAEEAREVLAKALREYSALSAMPVLNKAEGMKSWIERRLQAPNYLKNVNIL